MALTTEEQKFYDFAKAALPPWMPDPDEFLMGAAKMFGGVEALRAYLFGQALIGGALGATATTPDWLDQHARDRGTSRQFDESDEALRERIRNVPDALTRVSLLSAINAILVAEGLTDEAGLVELPRHGAHSGEYALMTGTGGTWTKTGNIMRFTPDVLPWPRPPFYGPLLVPFRTTRIFVNVGGGNFGVFPITELDGNAAVFTNAAGVAGHDGAAPWQIRTHDVGGYLRDGFARAFSQRGYRSARLKPPRLIVILPFGSTAGTEASVREMLRQKKAAGIAVTIERRLIAP